MALVIDENILDHAEILADSNDVSGAWSVLAAAGDTYADKARPIIAEWQDPQSIFAMMVDVQWVRAGVSVADKQAKFLLVGKLHLKNYLIVRNLQPSLLETAA